MNHEWPAAVHKVMVALDEVTPEAPELSLVNVRPVVQQRPRMLAIAAVTLVVLGALGGLLLLGNQHDGPNRPNESVTVGPSSTLVSDSAACALLDDSRLSASQRLATIDALLESNPSALDPAALQGCQAFSVQKLRQLQALVLQRQAAVHASSTSTASSSTVAPTATP